MNDTINPRKLITTIKNWRNEKDIIFLSKFSEFFKFFIEKKIIKNEKRIPKLREYDPIKLAKSTSPLMQPLLQEAYNFHHV